MKIITMKRLTMDGEPLDPDYDEDPNDWFCVIETPEEEMVYDKAFHEPFNPASATKSLVQGAYIDLWNAMVKHAGLGVGLAWGDDDIYAYIRPDTSEPDLLEKYTDGDGETWLRME